MITSNTDFETHPFRIETTDLNTGIMTSEDLKTAEEGLARIEKCDQENFYMALWNRLAGDVIRDTHPEIV